ncbi:MAG: BadF/BadG/BcrA/BcrD ATPase family protein [Rariglobus sp.]|nr:BadF/BadG/BcrA/BcrD ATPase family protein [Rariglobus sp.]
MEPLLLSGIDVGGTTTRIALADASGLVRGEGRAPGAGLTEVSPEESASRLSVAWREACARAGHAPTEPVDALFAGFGSLAATRDAAGVRRVLKLAGIRARRMAVGHDSANAQAGARPAGTGVHVIAGTGSVVVARDAQGRLHRVGGWGPGIGDEGAAWWLACAALRSLTARCDAGKKPGVLDRDLLRALRIREPRELLAAVFSSGLDRAGFAALAQPVLARAAEGDRIAQSLLAAGADALGTQVARAAHRAHLAAPAVTVSGGMFDHAPGYARRMVASARRAGVNARLAPAAAGPLAGALLLARRLTAANAGDRADLAFVRRAAGSLHFCL